MSEDEGLANVYGAPDEEETTGLTGSGVSRPQPAPAAASASRIRLCCGGSAVLAGGVLLGGLLASILVPAPKGPVSSPAAKATAGVVTNHATVDLEEEGSAAAVIGPKAPPPPLQSNYVVATTSQPQTTSVLTTSALRPSAWAALPPEPEKPAASAPSAPPRGEEQQRPAAPVAAAVLGPVRRQPTCIMEKLGWKEVPEALCFYVDAQDCKLRQHPMTPAVVDSAFQVGDVSRLAKVVDKLARRETVTILEIGGSFTYGEGCADGEHKVGKCAWPARTERWFKQLFPASEIVWEHRPRRSTTSVGFLTGIGALIKSLRGVPDIIIVDTLINDVFEAMRGLTTTGVNFDQVQRGGFEALLRALRELVPDVHIVVMLDACPACIQRSEIHRDVAAYYKVTVVDYANMAKKHNKAGKTGKDDPDWLWPQSNAIMQGPYIKVGEKWPRWMPEYVTKHAVCCPTNHPPWTVHEKISEAMGYGLTTALETACRQQGQGKTPFYPAAPLMPEKILHKFPSCIRPKSFYSAMDAIGEGNAKALQPKVISGDWKLIEERKGKPGWIATTPGAVIHFPLETDMKGGKMYHAVTISWLTSYEGVTNAKARLIPDGRPNQMSSIVQLESTVKEHVSQVRTGFFGLGYIDAPYQFQWHNNDNLGLPKYVLEITLPMNSAGKKFKIVEVTSC
eukprot:TRINITY_DN112022_c0_g1_i1.p1 TRINITY_DN112022_c0_g1~~TRINITY_DN112022_c0_g1_i1.p1  ORF type:complete len:678 (-),score=109.81 TRINITY_DN112022_c0_g1_i1:382-2415(-)